MQELTLHYMKNIDKGGLLMLIKRKKIEKIMKIIDKLRDQNFNILTQYKFIQIAKALEKEKEILQEQSSSLIIDYGERDEQEHLIQDESKGIKIKKEYLKECSQKIYDIYELNIQMPDIYFSFDELDSLNLTLGELELLEPFIKE